MIQEAYCSYEVSKLLREKGFDEPCRSYFISDSDEYRKCTVDITSKNCSSGQVLRPTHQMACAWLREVHHIHIDIIIEGNGSCITYLTKIRPFKIIYPVRNYDSIDTNKVFRCNSYEEAVEAALKYSLENLI